MRNIFSKIPLNVIGLGFVGFFMQFGASLVYATGNVFVENNLLSDYQLILVRGFSESIPHVIKVFSGYISDRIGNRKLFLMIGYGSIFFFKICFFICSLTWIFPIKKLAILYVVTQILDRVMNCLRDGPRDALIADSTPKNLLSVSFALRKSIASLGSITSGILSFILIQYSNVTMSWIYFSSIFPVIIATTILYYMIKDVPWHKANKSSTPINYCGLRRQILKHLIFNGLIAYSLLNYDWKSWSFGLIYINLLIIYNNFDKIKFKPTNYEPVVAGLLVLFGFFFPTLGNLQALFYGSLIAVSLVHLNKRMIIVCLCCFVYTLLITFSALQPVILVILSGVAIQIMKYLKTTDTYTKLMENKEKLRKFGSIVVVSAFLVMGKINDTVYYKQLTTFGFEKSYTILLFVAMYIGISLSSILFGYMLKNGRYYLAGIIVFLGLISSNILLGFNSSVWFLISSALCCAVYNGGMETVFTTMIAHTIPSKEISGTLFGIFYTVMGIFNFVGVTFLDYTATHSSYLRAWNDKFNLFDISSSNNIQIASKAILIFPIIGLILFLYKNISVQDNN